MLDNFLKLTKDELFDVLYEYDKYVQFISENFLRKDDWLFPLCLNDFYNQQYPVVLAERAELRQAWAQSPLEVYLRNSETCDGVWLKLPSDADRLREALLSIGVSGVNYEISETKSASSAVNALSVYHSSIDELNMLAHFLTDLLDWEIYEVDAVIWSGLADAKNTAALINLLYEDNMDCFDLIDASNADEVGRYWAKEEPDSIIEGMTPEEYGRMCVGDEEGVFVKHGYMYMKRDIDTTLYTGIVPDEYRIAETAAKAKIIAFPKAPIKPKKSVLAALDAGKEKVAQADAARAERGGKPPSRNRNGQEQGG